MPTWSPGWTPQLDPQMDAHPEALGSPVEETPCCYLPVTTPEGEGSGQLRVSSVPAPCQLRVSSVSADRQGPFHRGETPGRGKRAALSSSCWARGATAVPRRLLAPLKATEPGPGSHLPAFGSTPGSPRAAFARGLRRRDQPVRRPHTGHCELLGRGTCTQLT